MTKFFFHFWDGETRSDDEWGLDLGGPERAYLEAVATARAMWSELMTARIDPMRCAFEIEDEGGERLFRLDFSELLDSTANAPARPLRAREAVVAGLKDSHGRAMRARSELRSSFDDVYRSLGESCLLLARLGKFERPPMPKR
jgi:hypothetical protein